MNRYKIYGIALLSGAILMSSLASNALAAGTIACTPISNQATLNYKVGIIDQTAILSDSDDAGLAGPADATVFAVASKVNLTNTGSFKSVVPNTTSQVLTFVIQNTGNEDARYQLQLYDRNAETVGGHVDNFDATNIRVYSDTNNTYAGDSSEVLISAAASLSGSNLGIAPAPANDTVYVAPDAQLWIHVLADIPATATDGQKDLFTLIAKSYHDTADSTYSGAHGTGGGWVESTNVTVNGCGEAVVLADTIDSDGLPADGGTFDTATPDGDAVATGYYMVTAATISVTKAYSVEEDPINGAAPGAQAIPGARVKYTITVTNNSTTTNASTLVLVDPIPGNTDYYIANPAAESTGTGTVTFSRDGGGTYANTVIDTGGGVDNILTHVKAEIPSLPFDDGPGPNVNTADVTFEVIIR